MKKRLLSIMMVFCMMLSLLPTTALAGTDTITIDGTEYTVAEDVSTTGLDMYTTPPTEDTYYPTGDNGYILWKNDTRILTMNNATIDTTTGSAYAITLLDTDTDVTIVAKGNNVIKAESDGIYQDSGNTVIGGDGVLTVTSTENDAISCEKLTITDHVTVNATSLYEGQHPSTGINAANGVDILGSANVTASSNGTDIYSSGNITINTTGTVDAPNIMSGSIFTHQAGTIKGSWVVANKGNYYNYLISIYGSLELTEDTTIQSGDVDNNGEDGLTVTDGAILTIPAGITLTVEDGTAIAITKNGTNGTNGKIVNNGTIAFPAGTTGAEIQALNIEGTGTIKSGDTTFIAVNGKLYPLGGDVSTTGLNLSVNTPTADTCYKAGSGYALYTPSNKTLTLQDATIDTTTGSAYAINLPDGDVTIVAEGENVLKSSTYGIYQNNGNAVIQGDGTLSVTAINLPINSDALTITGAVKVNATALNAGESPSPSYGIFTSKTLNILGSADVTASGKEGDIYCSDDVTIDTAGTVDAPEIRSDNFIYKAGIMKGSLVSEAKDDYESNCVYSVYGSVELTEDKTISDEAEEDGLTVTSGAILTIPAGITLTIEHSSYADGVPQITNKGTIVNNGTIAFPAGTDGAKILALKITGTGAFKIGDKDSIVVGENLYPYGGDISTKQLNLSVGTPTAETYYKAGSGYAMYTPSSNTLTLHNATIDTTIDTTKFKANAITLPNVAFTIVAEGDNVITSGSFGIFQNALGFVIKGNGKLTVTAVSNYAILCGSGEITITGDVTVNATSQEEICTDILSGQNLNILGNASVTASDIKNSLYSGENMTINTTGTVSAPLIYVVGNFTHTAGTMTGSMVIETKGSQNTYVQSVYGSVQLTENTTILNQTGGDGLIVTDGAILTIPAGITLAVEEGTQITNNGTLINNGTIVLPVATTAGNIKSLKLSGTGIVKVTVDSASYLTYNNSGEVVNVLEGNLDLSAQTSGTQAGGYTWTGDSTQGYTLALDNIYIVGNVILPTNAPITITTTKNSTLASDIYFAGGYSCNLTFAGSGALTVNGDLLGSANNDDIVTVQGGAQVTVNGRISIGASGGQDGTLIVSGSDTSLSVTGDSGSAVYLDTLQVSDGADMTVHSDEVGIFAHAGGVTVTGGSTLTVGCDYGVYIIGGKLTIDKTSTLVTDAAIAPFCVVDKTNSKAEGDAVSLPGVPSGTKITSVSGTEGNYWSLISAGGTLGVTNENNEPVTLSGAVTGTVTFVAAKASSSGGGGGSSTYHIITATAGKGGSISPSDKVSVASGSSKTFTITANKSYTVKDVLVDGVSVGAVTTYTFDKLAKEHTITASFEEIKEVVEEVVSDEDSLYDDVKDSDWFKEAVDYVTKKGLMSGTGDSKFSPYISTDRGMIVTILWRLEGQPSASAKANFTDVAQGKYYTEAVAWGAENKIVEGYGNGQFGPEDTITREQMAAILYRYSNFKNYDTTQGGMATREFSDYGEISGWALESVTWAVNADLLSGVNNSQLDPRGCATRAQVASILMRYCENMEK